MTKLLAQKDRPLVRALGFLYLRYVLKPELLWRYCEDVLIDDGRAILEEGRKETLGEWLRGVLTSQQYHNTQLPRIPTKIDRDIRARVALVDEAKERVVLDPMKIATLEYLKHRIPIDVEPHLDE